MVIKDLTKLICQRLAFSGKAQQGHSWIPRSIFEQVSSQSIGSLSHDLLVGGFNPFEKY